MLFRSLLDTRAKVSGVTGKFISDIVLQILSYVAQIERENILQRQMEDIREAKKKGIKFGRTQIEIPKKFDIVAKRWLRKELSLRAGAAILKISHTTFHKWLSVKGYNRQEN